jgi:putative pyruvate formate lyase activating enzyme
LAFTPSYIALAEDGRLAERINTAVDRLTDCELCPRQCRVNRAAGETGVCRTGRRAVASSYNAHFGEESPLVGQNGSGTIFMTYCNLMCVFCQNWDVSHQGDGREVTEGELAEVMSRLVEAGCHNINFVTPSHVVPQILEALPTAIDRGLNLPLVYNSGGYDAVETLRLLDGVFDIYMPDFKFWDADPPRRHCGVDDYRTRAMEAIREMHRQVGDLAVDRDGVARRGLLIRHLVMPGRLDDTRRICEFIANEISPDTYVNIMGQYRPAGDAREYPELTRPLDGGELEQAQQIAREAGLKRLDERRPRFMLMFER